MERGKKKGRKRPPEILSIISIRYITINRVNEHPIVMY